MSWLVVLFWSSVVGVFYIYAGYPLLIGLFARLSPKPVRKTPNDCTATVIMSIYNEAPRLEKKLRNLLEVKGSDRLVQILIGSDGSTDHPEVIVEQFNDPRIRLVSAPERRGKPSMLNDLMPQATGDIIIMMDVRQRLDDEAIPALLDNFSDPDIGVVSGELVFIRSESDTSAAESIDSYWRYEKWIRDRESRFASVPGATGALYAIRRPLARPIPAEAALDDVLIPMQAIALGYRCIFEPQAKIYDLPSQDPSQEAIRKRRTLAGCVQLLKFHPTWCLPFAHPISWQFTSHKILRLYSPVLLVAAFAASIPLALDQTLYAWMLGIQILLYMIGVGAMSHRANGKRNKARRLWQVPHLLGVFLMMQVALVMAWHDGLRYSSLSLWRKAD